MPEKQDTTKDGDFVVSEEMEEDDEQTLDEQENTEADFDHTKEIEDLAKEGITLHFTAYLGTLDIFHYIDSLQHFLD